MSFKCRLEIYAFRHEIIMQGTVYLLNASACQRITMQFQDLDRQEPTLGHPTTRPPPGINIVNVPSLPSTTTTMICLLLGGRTWEKILKQARQPFPLRRMQLPRPTPARCVKTSAIQSLRRIT